MPAQVVLIDVAVVHDVVQAALEFPLILTSNI